MTRVKAYDVRGLVGEEITPEFIHDVGAAFAVLLRGEGETTVAVGHDMRPSSPELAAAFSEGVRGQGLDVIMLGLNSTDQLYFAAGTLGCAGAMFTASHNPAQYNGIKLCRSGARPVSQDTGLREITDMLVDGVPAHEGEAGVEKQQDCLEVYGEYLRDLVDLHSIRPLVVAVDAANGMGGHHRRPRCSRGCRWTCAPSTSSSTARSQPRGEPAGPGEPGGPAKFVVEQRADIGLAFDGDADRCFVIDEKGDPVSPSAICGIVAKRYLQDNDGATIIHNLITSRAVPEIIGENGGTAVRTRVGHSFIKAKMAETGAVFGGEHSAHYYFTEFFNADSGILAAMHVLAALGSQDRPLSEMMAEYERYEASGEINSTVVDQAASTQAVLDAFADRIESVDRLDGVTVELKDTPAWFNVRASNTEPLLRLNVEAPTRAEVDALVEEILGVIRK